jgi:hypothetical protein
MAIVTIVSNRRAGGQLPGRRGLHRIKRILAPGYTHQQEQIEEARKLLKHWKEHAKALAPAVRGVRRKP